MEQHKDQTGYFGGQMLVAMPHMQDPRFARAVLFLCSHSEDGAMGLVINRLIGEPDFSDLLEQLDINPEVDCSAIPIHFGGPVETGRGFVLHSPDYMHEGTLLIEDQIGLTATIDIVRAIAEGKGPQRRLVALGYAGWGAGQLETEMRENAWLSVPFDGNLLFDDNMEGKWERAIAKIGVDPMKLSSFSGHA